MSKLIELKSPFAKYPGSIWIPESIDAADFNIWWETFNEIEDDIELGTDKRHATFTTWQSRFHLIRKCTLKVGKEYEVEPTGLKLPSRLIAEWFINETDPHLDLEMDLKNALGPPTTPSSTTSE